MAYVDAQRPTNRVATITTVALLHAGLAYALVTGFGVSAVVEFIENPEGKFIPEPTPTVDLPPLPEPKADDPVETPPIAPKPRFDIDSRIDFTVIDPPVVPKTFPSHLPNDTLELPKFTPSPAPQPRFSPVPAQAKGNPGAWVTANDYPSRELRRQEEGTTGFRLTIDERGRVTDCAITAGSGSPGLDEAACKYLRKRARFAPATGADGKSTSGTYENRIRWEIPD